MRSLLLAIGCSGDPPPPEPACEATWEGFAQPFLTTWCLPCHSASVTGDDRHGAPETVNFDTYASTVPWTEAIALVAGDPEGWMPPAGGVTDAERAALREWVACGAPGPTSTPPDPCAGAVSVLDGPLVIVADPGTAHDCLVEVTGNLVVTGATASLSLPRLATVGGDVALDASLVALDLPSLATVGGTVTLAGHLPAQPVLVALDHVGGFVVSGASGIEVLDLPRLERVDGDFRVEGAPDLATIVHTSDLEEVGSDLVIGGNRTLRAVRDFASLTRVGGDFVIGGNGAVDLVNGFWFLEEVGGDLEVRDEGSLVEIDAFDELASVGGAFRLLRNGALLGVGVPRLETVGTDLVIEDDDALDVLDPLFGVRAVGGDLVIRGNQRLEVADTDALVTAIGAYVGGSIVVEDNG